MFSNDVYKKQNGLLFVILFWIMFFYLLFMIVLMIFSKGPITYPGFLEHYADFLSMLMGWLFIISFVGLPFVSCLYIGMKKLYVNSRLNINDDKIYYIQQTEAFWTIFGRSTQYKIYNILNVKNYEVSRRWIKIYGQIEEEVVHNKNELDKKNIEYVRIARAFDTDNNIIKYLNNINN